MSETTPETPATPETPETPETPAPPAAPETPQADPAEESKVKRANAEAARYRTERNALQQQLEQQGETLAKLAAVFNPEASGSAADPEALASEATALRDETAQLKAELLVHTLAGENGGNPVALLDSRQFTTKLHGLDPAADDYHDQVAKAITDAVAKSSTLAAAGQGPSRGGVPGAGQGPASPGAVTQDQFDAWDYDKRAELYQRNPDLYRRLAGTAS